MHNDDALKNLPDFITSDILAGLLGITEGGARKLMRKLGARKLGRKLVLLKTDLIAYLRINPGSVIG